MPRPTAENDIPELTGLRIVAALCVVVSHLHALGMISAERVHQLLDGGRPAVVFFFVLSGFIMNHKYPRLQAGDREAAKRYAFSRFARLYPTLLLALCMALPVGVYLAATHAQVELQRFYAIKDHYSVWLSASALAQILCLTGWFPVAAINQPWNGPAWSLSCEFFFYATFPFVRPALHRLSSRTIVWALVGGWLLQLAWMLAIDAFVPPNRAGFLIFQFPLTHFFEFLAGISAGLLLSRCAAKQSSVLAIVAAVAAIPGLAALQWSGSNLPISWALTPAFIAAIVATVKSSGSPWLAPLRQRPVLALGHASYALYITHAPIMVGASVLGFAMVLGWSWLPLLMLVSLLVHYGYAEPARRYLLRSALRPRSINA